LADLIDPAIAGPVDLDDVHVVTGINGQCDLGTGIEVPGSIIGGIQGLGENASGARFAHPSSASEEISMPYAVGFDRPQEGVSYGVLTDQLTKRLGTVTARDNGVFLIPRLAITIVIVFVHRHARSLVGSFEVISGRDDRIPAVECCTKISRLLEG
jgi:hypothetical protein